MTKSRDELKGKLDMLAKQMPAMVAQHTGDGDFWSAFAGASDFFVDDAGAADYAWVLCELDRMLEKYGKLSKERIPSDDLPPSSASVGH